MCRLACDTYSRTQNTSFPPSSLLFPPLEDYAQREKALSRCSSLLAAFVCVRYECVL